MPNNITTTFLIWFSFVAEDNSQCSNVVCNDSISHINSIGVLAPNFACVWTNAGVLMNCIEDRNEQVCVIIGGFLLHNSNHTLKTHATINVFLRQRT